MNVVIVIFAAYNEKVVAFLRQPSLVDIVKEKQNVFRVTPSLWTKLKTIRNEGTEALVRLSNDVELIILLRWDIKLVELFPLSYLFYSNCVVLNGITCHSYGLFLYPKVILYL